MMNIRIEKTKNPKNKPNENEEIEFGSVFTDHMFIMDYNSKKGWNNPRIIEYQPIVLDPSALVFHYGQSMFEGMKAYKTDDNRTLLFRPMKNIERANNSNRRICMPEIPEEDFLQAIEELVRLDEEWIPKKKGSSLYIRPFVIATEPSLNVKPSSEYKFIIILSPVGAYYKEGLNPVKIWIEDEYVRAVRGGIGEAKTGGNYAASMLSQEKAHEAGYSQVLWLDGIEHKYIEEVGAMNIFFKIDGKIVTPMLNGSILPGVTRASVIELCKSWGYDVEERKISVDELYDAANNGRLEEVFGSGTAAVISPVGNLKFGEKVFEINGGRIGEVSQKVYDTITGIQTGKIEDSFGWTIEV
ncbi:MAG: branched-chain amino acid aminotransferase [Clostridia bacterium]